MCKFGMLKFLLISLFFICYLRSNDNNNDFDKFSIELKHCLISINHNLEDSLECKRKIINALKLINESDIEITDKIKIKPEFVIGDIYISVRNFAQKGDEEAISAILSSKLSRYGKTVEGSQWTNELIWEVFEKQSELTLKVLESYPESDRKIILDKVFYTPIHDGFDFNSIYKNICKFDENNFNEINLDSIKTIIRVFLPK